MKKVFSALVLSLVLTTSAYAEHEKNTYNSQKPVTCMSPQQMLAIVDKQFKEAILGCYQPLSIFKSI